MPKPEFKEDACAICGIIVFRDQGDTSIFCGKITCLHTYADQKECSQCGVPAEEFVTISSIKSGRVLKKILSCPKHSEYQITRYSFEDQEP